MTMGDSDWGESTWDVDAKADSLNKSLFGRKAASLHTVKADVNPSDKNETGFAADSDDDEKLSKKAKKKLKERRRMENKKSKTNSASTEEVGQKETDEVTEKGGKNRPIVNSKKNALKSNTPVKKQKQKVKEKSSVNESPLDLKSNHIKELAGEAEASGDKGHEKVTGKGKKQKKPVADEDSVDIPVKLKKKKTDEKDSIVKLTKKKSDDKDLNVNTVTVDEPPKKKRKRNKKKKPNSKRNKYAHLGRKSTSLNQNRSEGDSDNDNDETIEGDKTRKVTVVSEKDSGTGFKVKSTKGKKRKNSTSVDEEMPSKKTKVSGETEIHNVEMRAKKKKKGEKFGEIGVGKEKKEDKINEKKKAKKSEVSKMEPTADLGNVDEEMETETGSLKTLNTEKRKKKKKSFVGEDSMMDAQKTIKDQPEKAKSSPFFSSSQGSELQQKMVDKLASARFRFINEQLYTIKGGEALRMFQQDKSLMHAYNTGFQGQVKQWSVNPLDVIIKQFGTKSASLKVADFGCGEARLSASVPQKVHSFDLFPLNDRVTVCDMSKTPLANESMDVVVFCLSLMGTNLNDYILEANRILKEGGLLKIAEVVSRFTNPNHFINAVSSLGFRAVNTRELSAMFYLMDFKKVKKVEKVPKQAKTISLKPCLYKKR